MANLIVVGTDGTETANLAVQRAADLARDTGAQLHVISAYAAEAPVSLAEGGRLRESDVAIELAEQSAALVRGTVPGLTTAAVQGTPADGLVKEAERLDASMIVVGNKRVQGFARVLGSVAAGVAHHAPCDVLIVRTH
ncbi:MAG: universal stress protein [Nocardioides sp.]|jgi:nucleotide-binding universal stress UspA family protein